MNITSSQRLKESAITSAIGIIFAIGSVYIPFLSLLVFFVGIPYIIITAKNNIKYGIISVIISVFIILMSTDLLYSLTLTLLFFIPAICIGAGIYKNEKSFNTILWGFLASSIGILVFIKIAPVFLGFDLIEKMIHFLKENINMKLLDELNLSQSNVNIKDIIDQVYISIPSAMINQSIMMSFINYYLALYILKRNKGYDKPLPSINEFVLPNNIILGSFMIVMLVFVSKYIYWIHFESLNVTVETIFTFIFFLQGFSVYGYFLDKIGINSKVRNILLFLSIFLKPLYLILSLVGMLDSIINFRKIKR